MQHSDSHFTYLICNCAFNAWIRGRLQLDLQVVASTSLIWATRIHIRGIDFLAVKWVRPWNKEPVRLHTNERQITVMTRTLIEKDDVQVEFGDVPCHCRPAGFQTFSTAYLTGPLSARPESIQQRLGIRYYGQHLAKVLWMTYVLWSSLGPFLDR